MLDFVFELIVEASSNSLVMFCFCNIIIVIILKGSKSESGVSEEINFPHLAGCSNNMDNNSKEETDFVPVNRENDRFFIDVAETADECEEIIECDDEENDDDSGDENDKEEQNQEGREDEEEENEDELRKRVEAFIAKVNREWKNEKLRALNSQT